MDFPILPFIDRRDDGSLRFFKRNPRLFTPKDFDYSPYFHIIKYPFLGLDDIGVYRQLPWSHGLVYSDLDRSYRADLGHARLTRRDEVAIERDRVRLVGGLQKTSRPSAKGQPTPIRPAVSVVPQPRGSAK